MDCPYLLSGVLLLALLSGCLTGEDGDTQVKGDGTPSAHPGNITADDLQWPIDLDDFFVLQQPRDAIRLVGQGFDVDETADELVVYFIDASGKRHEDAVSIEVPGHGGEATANWTPPTDVQYPLIVKPQCACWISLDAGQVNETLLWSRTGDTVRHYENFTAIWPDAQDPADGVMHDEVELSLSKSLIGLQLYWTFNLDGDSTVWTPSGRDLVYMKGQGRTIEEGHAALGFRPLEPGAWRFEINGNGWVAYEVVYVTLTNQALASYGVTAPG